MNGHIFLNRKIFEWEWWHDINTYRLFTYMILRANWKPMRYMGVEIPRGAFVSSLQHLSVDTDLTIGEVRTALTHLETTGEVTRRTTNKFTVFIVNNYDVYQPQQQAESHTEQHTEQHAGSQASQQTINKLLATNEEYKKENKENNNTVRPKKPGEDFETLNHNFEIIYGIYPVKKGRTKAFNRYKQWVSSSGRTVNGRRVKLTNSQIYDAVQRYVDECDRENKELRYYMHFDTLMGDSLMDYVRFDE